MIVLIIPLLVALSSCGDGPTPEVHQKKISVPAGEPGSLLPAFETVDLQGHKLRSADLRNKLVLIDFWATWCAPCRTEMPGYQKLLDRYRSQGLVVIGFKADVMMDTEDPVSFLREVGVTYPIAVGSEQIRNKFGGLKGLPTTYLYDREGILKYKVIGFEYTTVVEKQIQQLL